jgi:dTDP-4-amino-4,6-dideoxygalactose transaminase
MTSSDLPLALFGGKPAFAEPLHVGRPNIGDRTRLMERISDILDRRWLTNDGPYVRAFERCIADYVGVRECVVTCNGTIALEILIRAVGMGGEVIVPSFTFVATAHALQWQEIKPVFCDIDPLTHTLDPARVEELITPNTGGIISVHLWGRVCDVDALQAIADRHGLPLIYDASHAFGCSRGGRTVGSFGRAETFSFHATKFLNSFEGGAIVTDDAELAEKMRLMRNFGFEGKDNVVHLGINGKMSEVSAAMGLTSFEAMDEFIEANRRNYECYRKTLGCIPGVRLLDFPAGERCNYQYIVVEADEHELGLSRDQLVRVLEAENVLARRYFTPGAHLMEPYRSFQPQAGLVLPETRRLSSRVMTLPNGQSVSEDDIRRIAGIVETARSHAESVRASLGSRELVLA